MRPGIPSAAKSMTPTGWSPAISGLGNQLFRVRLTLVLQLASSKGEGLVFFERGLQKGRGEIRMISQVLFDGLAAHHDPESMARIHVDRFL
jgi:hypothetical protein